MRKAFAISYDLKQPNRDYSGLYEAIKKAAGWWHYLESTWLVVEDVEPAAIWQRLRSSIDGDDRLLIIEVRDNVQGWLPKDAWDWITKNVPRP